MKDIINRIWKIVVFAILIIGICIGIYKWIASLFEEPDLLTAEEVAIYEVPSNLLKDYTTYYFVEDCIENLVTGCAKNEYDALYDLYIKVYKEGYSKSDIISALKDNFKAENGTSFSIKGIYDIENIGILAIIKMHNQEVNILFNLNQKEGATYSFALIK